MTLQIAESAARTVARACQVVRFRPWGSSWGSSPLGPAARGQLPPLPVRPRGPGARGVHPWGSSADRSGPPATGRTVARACRSGPAATARTVADPSGPPASRPHRCQGRNRSARQVLGTTRRPAASLPRSATGPQPIRSPRSCQVVRFRPWGSSWGSSPPGPAAGPLPIDPDHLPAGRIAARACRSGPAATARTATDPLARSWGPPPAGPLPIGHP